MYKRKIMLIIALICFAFCCALIFFAGLARAETPVSFQWTPNTDSTTGYSIVMDGGTNIILNLPGKETSTANYTIVEDTTCHSFSIFAYNEAGKKSDLGNLVSWCPPEAEPPETPQQYLLILEPVH